MMVASSRLFAIFGTLLLGSTNAIPPSWKELVKDSSVYSFDDFVTDFDKDYQNDANECQRRRTIFETNLRTILEHNRQADPSRGGHLLGINQFADQIAEELPRGYAKHHPSRFSSEKQTSRRSLSESDLPFDVEPVSLLPSYVNWRLTGVTTPVKSQGMCGSCWAFASTAVLESHIALQTGKLFSFSMQELVSCDPNVQHCGGRGGCGGSTAELAMDFVAGHGMVQEWDFGYQSYHGERINCTLPPKPNTYYYQGAVAAIDSYALLPTNNYTVLMNAVAKWGPVAVSVACIPWHLYQSGVFSAPLNTSRATDINHLVVLEGYGIDGNTYEPYWLVRNSWAPMWGENGYIRLKRVDPADLDDPDDDCGMDRTPGDGVACTEDEDGNPITPPAAKICGNSGILFNSVVPVGGHLV